MEDCPTGCLADAIAQCCHDTFKKLPKHGKPTRKHNGQLEWTVIAAIIMAVPRHCADLADSLDDSWDLKCLSLATGSKCLPRGQQSPFGDRLNDCHAEVLARRGFNLWCLQQLQACLDAPDNEANPFVLVNNTTSGNPGIAGGSRPFKLRNPRARFHLYVSQAPCGDATTESLAQIQSEESRAAYFIGRHEKKSNSSNATATTTATDTLQSSMRAGSKHELADQQQQCSPPPKIPRTDSNTVQSFSTTIPSTPTKVESDAEPSSPMTNTTSSTTTTTTTAIDDTLLASKDPIPGKSLAFRRGRIDYECITALRTKPGRVDSDPTLSMSCSDKMARWNVLGLTSAVVASFLDRPIYLDAIVAHELYDASALQRALYGRLAQVQELDAGVAVTPCGGPGKTETGDDAVGRREDVNNDTGRAFRLHRPKVWYTSLAFEYSKEVMMRRAEQEQEAQAGVDKTCDSSSASAISSLTCSSSVASTTRLAPVASPNGLVWTEGLPVEVIVNGCKAGASAKKSKQGLPLPLKSRSRLCKSLLFRTGAKLWRKVCEQNESTSGRQVGDGGLVGVVCGQGMNYRAWKQQIAPEYQQAKVQLLQGVLRHWVQGLPELEQFDFNDCIVPSQVETLPSVVSPPSSIK